MATLARTASTLDEKAVDAEKKAASVDAALRSFMEEQRTERAALIQAHQEQILSLMEIVKDDERDRESSFSHLEVSNQNSHDASSDISKASGSAQSSRVMILANERIEALERQLEELEEERETKEMYKQREEKTREELTVKEDECEGLKRELNQLRTSLRQVREYATQPSLEGSSGDGAGAGNNNGVAEFSKSILDIVMSGLHPSSPRSASTSYKGKYGGKADRNGGTNNTGASPPKRRAVSKLQKPSPISPRIQRHVELMHTSDSEEDEEVPEWANDIMADLAVIASGNIPAALLTTGSVSFSEDVPSNGLDGTNANGSNAAAPSSSTTTSTTTTGTTTSASASTSGNGAPNKAGSVFDRLTNPENFTGVQKTRTTSPKRLFSKDKRGKPTGGMGKGTNKTRERADALATSTSSLSTMTTPSQPNRQSFDLSVDTRKSRSFDEVARTDTTVMHGNGSINSNAGTGTSNNANAGGSSADKKNHRKAGVTEADQDNQGRSVFERLLSPSMYTGTQKDKIQSVQAKKSQQAEEMLDDLLSSDVESSVVSNPDEPNETGPSTIPHQSQQQTPQSNPQQVQPPDVSKKVSEYTRQNVFERLQRTTTHSYAEKKKPAGKAFVAPTKSVGSTAVAGSSTGVSESDDHAPGNNSNANLSTSPPSTIGKDKTYGRQNVFERLQKTTTAAYAKKKTTTASSGGGGR